MRVKLKLKREIFNNVYYHLLKCLVSTLIVYGGAGSGKSYFLAQRLILKVINEERNFLVIRKVGNTIRDSVFAEVKKIIYQWNLSRFFSIQESNLTIIYRPTKYKIIFRGLDDPEKMKSITVERGQLTDIWIEEATELSLDDYLQLSIRLRGRSKVKKQLVMSFNPISHLHWIKKTFFETVQEDVEILQTTYRDNQFLTEDDIKRIEKLKDVDENYYRIYGLGEWGITKGLIFPKVTVVKEPPARFDEVGYGLDFGYSVNPSSLIRVYSIGDSEFYLEEVIYSAGLTNEDLISVMEEAKIDKTALIVADSAEPKSIEQIRRAGYNIKPCIKGADSVRSGIDFLKSKNIFVLDFSINLKKEFFSYAWKRNARGEYAFPPVPVKAFDHGIDATRYYISTRFMKPKKDFSAISADYV